MKNSLDYQYIWLLEKIKKDGVVKETRNGKVRSIFGFHLRHRMGEGFPLLTTKKMWFKGIRTELEWFLNGSTNIQPLVKKGNNIWVGDAYKRFKTAIEGAPHGPNSVISEEEFIDKIKNDDEFAEQWGDMGPIYGKQWREFTSVNKYGISSVDQIQKLINDLQEKPDSRRLMVNAWNPVQITDMVLPPCHYGFQVWTRELTVEERHSISKWKDTQQEFVYHKNGVKDFESKEKYDNFIEDCHNILDEEGVPKRGITLMWNQRSVDVPLGLPFNIASYGLLLMMIADEVNMIPLELIGSLGDCHIYENQMEGVEEQLQRYSHPLPEVQIMDGIYSRGNQDIRLLNYESEDKIHFPLSN